MKEISSDRNRPGREAFRLTLLFLTGVLLTLPLYLNPWLRLRSDALVHIGIVNAIARGGLSFPNPFLAGSGFFYYWGYNLLVWLGCRISGLEPSLLMGFFNSLAAGALPPLLYLTVRSSGGGRGGGFLAAGLGFFGLNGLGWTALARSGSGAALTGIFPYLDAVTPPGAPFALGFFASKFLVATSVGPALAAFAFALLLLEKARRKNNLPAAAAAGAALSATTFLNLFAGAVAVGGTVLYSLAGAFRRDRRTAARLAAAGILGGAAGTGAILLLMGGAEGSALRVALPGWDEARLYLVVTLPFWAVITAAGGRQTSGLSWAGVIFATALCLLFRLPAGNQYKFFFPLAVQLSILAGVRLGGDRRRKALAVIVTALCLPTTLLGLAAYRNETPPDWPLEAVAELGRDARRRLPLDAVVVSSELEWAAAAFIDRDAYLARPHFLRSLRIYRPEIRRRRELVRRADETARRAATIEKISRETNRPAYWLGTGREPGERMETVITSGRVILARPAETAAD